MSWRQSEGETFSAKIYVAGDYAQAIKTCREYCSGGFCVSVKPVDFVYKFGMETGIEVTVINYIRFPEPIRNLEAKTVQLAQSLAEDLVQGSYTIQFPDKTIYRTRRE